MKDSIKIFQLNVRGISDINKFNTLVLLIAQFQCELDVIVFSGVKLKTTFPVQIYNIPGFNRFVSLRSEKGGGGIVSFVNQKITTENEISISAQFEKLSLILNIDNVKYRLLAYYRAPTPSNFGNFLDDVEDEISSSDVKTFIVGDVNVNSFTLTINPPPDDNMTKQYRELLASYGYSVTNTLPTRLASGKTIDHFTTNTHDSLCIHNDTIEMDPALTDHNIIISSIKCFRKSPRMCGTVKRSKVDYKMLINHFPDISLETFTSNDPNQIAKCITSAIKNAVELSSTEKTFTVKHYEKIGDWNSEEALTLMQEKDKLLNKRRKKPQSEKISTELKEVSERLRKTNEIDYRRYIQQKVSTKDPKKLWKNLNAILGRSKDVSTSTLLDIDGKRIQETAEIAKTFNDFFANCAQNIMNSAAPSTSDTQFVEHQPTKSITLETPNTNEILTIIKCMKNNSAAGHDGISSKVLKKLSQQLAPLLIHLITSIFATGIYPSTFKVAVVTPIYKSGPKTSVDNYRPISVLPVLNKIVEKTLHKRLLNFFNDHTKLLYSHQFGFRPKSGTENAAIELSNMIMRAIDENKIATGVFMDLKKAFDIVDHDLLLEVLEKYGIRGAALEIFRNYLKDREQIVKIDNIRSNAASIKTGVVQGSCLGPLLYLIFINAIGSLKIFGKLFLFADDAVLVNIHEKTSSINDTIRLDMTPILEFFTHRKMIINSSKTNFMLFSSSRMKNDFPNEIMLSDTTTIKRVTSCKYLGLHIDEALKWSEHIAKLERKLAPANGVLWKLRHALPFTSKKLIYDTLFQSHLHYMSALWGLAPVTALKNAQVLQNRALRNVYNLPNRANRVNMFTHQVESHLPIRGICTLAIATYIYNALHKNSLCNIQFQKVSELHSKNLRNTSNLRPVKTRTEFGARTMEAIGPRIFNKIPQEIKSSRHQHAFKWTFKCHLRNERFVKSCFDSTFFSLHI